MSDLDSASYFSLATFRKDGRKVATPVWFAPAEDAYFVFSAADAGKVKRLRNSNRAEIARCDIRGKILGDWHPAVAELVDDANVVHTAHRALRKKYGVQMLVADIGARLTGRYSRRAYIRVEISGQPAATQAAPN